MNKAIEWFAHNGVAANLLMFVILAWGLYAVSNRIPLEVFPTFELEIVNIRVPFPGASPAEVEQGVTIKIEQQIYDLEGIKTLRSTASEGMGKITVEVAKGYDPRAMLDDIKLRIDAISNLPEEAERPDIYISQRRRDVITAVISGDLPERQLRQLGERVRDDLVNLPQISQVELSGVRPYEIAIEIPEQALRQHGLTLAQVATAIDNASLDLAAGAIKTAGGEVLIRTKGQAYNQADFENIVVLSHEGTRLRVADIGTVRDGFEEEALEMRFNNRFAVAVDVYRVGEQSAIEVAAAVKDYIETARALLPPSVRLDYWGDRSRIVKARLNTLLNSAVQGGVLILLLLTLFLRFSVALWVFIGVPVSFMGGLALMPELGITINIVSLFAFILVLGIVVDDAIVTGENIYSHLQRGTDPTLAAIKGTQEIAVPVTFGVLTTVAAFLPLLMIEGVRGKIFAQIPMIVVPVLLFSLIESKLILPAHLKHVRVTADDDSARRNVLLRLQRKIARGLELFIIQYYQPVLTAALRQRYLTLSLFVGVAIIVFSLVSSGHLRFMFFPRVQSEFARASLVMPVGTPFETTARHIERITAAAEQLRDQYIDPVTNTSIITGIMSTAGSSGGSSGGQSHLGRVMFQIVAPEERSLPVTSSQLVREWRRLIGVIPGAKEINYRAEIGRGGNPIDVQLSGAHFDELQVLAERVKARLQQYPGVFDITDSFSEGKEEIQLTIKPQAQLLGLSSTDLARQVRQAFFGFEVERLQRGRDEVKVIVRYPFEQRRSLKYLETMLIRTPDGIEVPFHEVADARPGRGVATIERIGRNRTVNVSADINKETADLEAIKTDLQDFLTTAVAVYPGVKFSLEGEAREQRESFQSLFLGLGFVLFVIYTLLAIPFKSYSQPLMVMCVIPFGVVGAILGHIIMAMNLSVVSIMGMLALTGVVVNDSLVLVDYVNRCRREGQTVADAVRQAGVARFRPVLLTSLTTFAGLMPLIFEKSTQAQFLIPMAVSLGFGILFATFITLLLIPVNYLILEDGFALARRLNPTPVR